MSPYTEAARRIDAEKAVPVPIVHAFPGVDDDVVCGHYAQHADDRVSLDWDEVTCGDCHQTRIERGRLADELAEAHAELARQILPPGSARAGPTLPRSRRCPDTPQSTQRPGTSEPGQPRTQKSSSGSSATNR